MSTKGHIYYDVNTECYSDSSDGSVNLLCELHALISLNIEDGNILLEWSSISMPKKLVIPESDVRRINIDRDGLIVEMSEDTETAKKIWIEKDILSLAA